MSRTLPTSMSRRSDTDSTRWQKLSEFFRIDEEVMCGQKEKTGEEKLILAILRSAFMDLFIYPATSIKHRYAKQWIMSDADGDYTFRYCFEAVLQGHLTEESVRMVRSKVMSGEIERSKVAWSTHKTNLGPRKKHKTGYKRPRRKHAAS